MFLVTLLLISIVVLLFYVFLIWNFDYWKKRGVNGPKPLPMVGNYPSVYTQKRHMTCDITDAYRAFKKDEDFVGIFNCRTPQLLITSPALIRRILVNDFKYFHDNDASTMVDEKSDFILANNPFALTGEEWKERRAMLAAGLTPSRIKTVYPVTNKICKRMTEYIRRQTLMAPQDGLDIKDTCLRFTADVVSDCVLGLDADSFSDKPTVIHSMIKRIFDQSFVLIVYLILAGLWPAIKKFYKVTFVSAPVSLFFVDLMNKAIEIRKSQASDQQERVDFLNHMLQLQKKKNLSIEQVTANTMTFMLDGFETTASVISHCLILLGREQNVQAKLRAEIEQNLNKDKEIDFDALNELPYLDACVYESIRLFPPGIVGLKLCTEPIELKNKNGKTLHVQKGEIIVLPLHAIMTDEDYYPDPLRFDPERFSAENGGVKKYREMGVYHGFSDGPRVCMGMRFALAQTKAAIVEIIKNYNVTVHPKTRTDYRLDPKHFLARLDGDLLLNFEAIN